MRATRDQLPILFGADPAAIRGADWGDLFYLPPGHTPLVEEDTEFVEFRRPAEHQPVLDHVARAAAAT